MKLSYRVDEPLLMEYHKRKSPVLIYIWWESSGEYYPESNWMDFGIVILSWWIAATNKLYSGSKREELIFMDGPYRLYLHSEVSELIVKSKDTHIEWRTTIEDLAFELIRVGDEICSVLDRMNVKDSDSKSLLNSLDKLKNNALSTEPRAS